jgi:inner membrane protein
MDSLTHIALGACLGEMLLDRKLGRKAMVWGAVAQSIPDIDFVANFWMQPPASLLAHRGLTHSILFALISSVVLALAAEKWHRPHNISYRKWLWFFLPVIGLHLLLDVFNNYGVGWFEPFSSERLSLNAIYVADPWFSIGPAIACLVLIFLRLDHPHRMRWAGIGMVIPVFYLGYALYHKYDINQAVDASARAQGIRYTRKLTTPTPLNNWLWFVVLEDSAGYHIGHHSVFDGDQPITLTYFPRNDALLTPMLDHREIGELKSFSQGWYTVEHWGDTLVFNDLRFGQMIGWRDPHAHFAFHYFLDHGKDNKLVVQRGRFAGWDAAVLQYLFERIRGLRDAAGGSKK